MDKNKPRYLMGVGYPEDLLVCSCLGIDMYDCVYPTRTARIGTAFTRKGNINLYKKSHYRLDFKPIEETCTCEVKTANNFNKFRPVNIIQDLSFQV